MVKMKILKLVVATVSMSGFLSVLPHGSIVTNSFGEPLPRTTSESIAKLCSVAVPEARATWLPAPVNGYAQVENFASTPSLYETYWRIRLLESLRGSLSGLGIDLQRIALAIRAGLPGAILNHQDGVSELDELQYGIGVMEAAHEQLPSSYIAADLHSLLDGGLYRVSPGVSPTWPSTALALQVAKSINLTIAAPSAVISWRAFTATTATQSINLDEGKISTLQVLSLRYPSLYRKYASQILSFLRAATQRAITAGESGPTLLELTQLKTLGVLLGANLPMPSHTWFNSIVVSGGLLDKDPQTTSYALALNDQLPKGSAASILVGLGPKGWIDITSSPNPLSTFEGVEILRQCHARFPVVEVRLEFQNWIKGMESTNSFGPQNLETLYTMVELGNAVGVKLPSLFVSNALNDAQSSILLKPKVTGYQYLIQLGIAFSLIRDLNSQSAELKVETTIGRVATDPSVSPNIASAVLLSLVGSTYNDSSYTADAQAMAQLLKVGNSYSVLIGKTAPDLVSTSEGYAICGTCHGQQQSVDKFVSLSGPILQLQTNVNAGIVNLDSLYYALLLEGPMLRVPPPFVL